MAKQKTQPTRRDIEAQFKHAFQEFLMSGELVGLQIANSVSDVLWGHFYRYLEHRFDRLFEPDVKQHTKRNIKNIQRLNADRRGELPREYLFVKIPKTGTASINQIVQQFAGHRTASKWRIYYSQEAWDRLFKFSFVRNPYDRFLSGYYHCNLEAMDINEWVSTKGIEEARKINDQVFRPMTEYLCDADGELLVDMVGKFEQLEEDWKKIAKALNLEQKLPHLHAKADDRMALTEASKKVIYRYYKEDFERWNYEK